MSSARENAALLRRAQENVARAAAEWTPVDAAATAECLSALEAAASDLRTVTKLFQPDAVLANKLEYEEMRSDLLALKRSLAGLSRLVDASAAFIRNLPGQNSGIGETYQPGGHLCALAALPASSVEA